MSKALKNRNIISSYEVMFIHSPEYFVVENAKMIFESQMVRFLVYHEPGGMLKEDIWFPYCSIYRIKKYQ